MECQVRSDLTVCIKSESISLPNVLESRNGWDCAADTGIQTKTEVAGKAESGDSGRCGRRLRRCGGGLGSLRRGCVGDRLSYCGRVCSESAFNPRKLIFQLFDFSTLFFDDA